MRIAQETPRVVRDSWWLSLWRPFWGHPRLAVGGALAAGMAVALLFWPAAETPTWAEPVVVQDVSTPDPDKSVMVYSTSAADQPVTVIWLFNSSDGPTEES